MALITMENEIIIDDKIWAEEMELYKVYFKMRFLPASPPDYPDEAVDFGCYKIRKEDNAPFQETIKFRETAKYKLAKVIKAMVMGMLIMTENPNEFRELLNQAINKGIDEGKQLKNELKARGLKK